MATQKALYTNKQNFIHAGYGETVVTPYIFYNGEDAPTSVPTQVNATFGSPKAFVGSGQTFVDGIRGKAVQLNGTAAFVFRNWYFPSSQKHAISFWVKPTANDVATTTAFRILATHRGDGFADKGFHIAIANGNLNVRVIGATTVNLFTNGAAGQMPAWTFAADQWHYVYAVYDRTKTTGYQLEVYVNGARRIYASTVPDLGAFERSFTIGDMLTSAGALSKSSGDYVVRGAFDEFMYQYGADVWTPDQSKAYYDAMIAKGFVDYSSNPGSIQLPKATDGNYSAGAKVWLSPIVDLGAPFEKFGRAQVTAQKPAGTKVNVFTRSGDSAASMGAWAALREDGTITSVNKRFVQVKIELSSTFLANTPIVEEVQILDYAKALKFSLTHEPLRVYKDLASGLEPFGELKNAYDIIINEEINGEDSLTFKLPINDPKRRELGSEPVELIAEIAYRRYTIKEATDKREDDGRLYTEFNCEAVWYELRDFKVKSIDLKATTAFVAMQTILSSSLVPTDWTLGVCDIPSTKTRDIKDDWKSVLELFRKVVDTFGGELTFDVPNKQVNLLNAQGDNNGVRFYYNKNLTNITRTIDTYDLVTRLYPYGKGQLGISTVNGGFEYIEDYSWVDALGLRNRVRIGHWKDENYTVPGNLLDDARILLTDAAKPRIAYAIAVQDLSSLSGHEHESFGLGDTVYTVDKDLFVTETKYEVVSRIVRRKYNVREPWKTVVELNQPKRMLADAVKRAVDDKLDYLAATDPLSTTESSQMTVFNNLLNSRADEGINADWLQGGDGSGFVPSNAGFSGDWSFKVSGEYGKTNTLTQRVYGVSHRSAYTVSAAVAKDGTITRGGTLAEPFVGIKVIIHYKDGTSETKFLEVPDATAPEAGA